MTRLTGSQSVDEIIAELHAQHRRSIADVVMVISDRAWLRGWIIGVTTGASILGVIWALW